MVKKSGMRGVGMKGIYNRHLAGQTSHHVRPSPLGASHWDLSKAHLGLGGVLPGHVGASV